MNKKKYDKNTQFFVTYASNERNEIHESFKVKRIMSDNVGIHDILVEHNCELSDGEVAQALEKVLNNIYSNDTYSYVYISVLNWWAI